MRIVTYILIFLPFVSFCQSEKTGAKLETTIYDTAVVSKWNPIDTLRGHEDFDLDEYRYFIPYQIKKKYDTIIVFYNRLKTDTCIKSIYKCYDNYLYKEWFENGTIRTISDSKLNINKSWYPNGQLRWDKVISSDIPAIGFWVNEKNKSWFPDGKVRSDFVKNDSDKYIFSIYYPNGQTRYRSYIETPDKISNGDGCSYPLEYKHPVDYKEEFYCDNGQIIEVNEAFKLFKNYKTYYCNGQIKSRSDYYRCLWSIYGKFETFYSNGQIKTSGEMTPYSKDIKMQALPTGKWKYYDKKGQLIRTEEYDDKGKLIKTN